MLAVITTLCFLLIIAAGICAAYFGVQAIVYGLTGLVALLLSLKISKRD